MFAPKQPNKAGHHPSKNKSQEKKPFVLQRQGLNAGIQEKLKVGQTNDRFEKEADSVADKVVSNTEAPKVETAPTPPIQTMKVGSGDLTQRVLREPQHTESDISTSIEVQKESQADVETEAQLSEKLGTSSASAPKSEVQLKDEEEVQLDKIDEQNTSKAEVEPVETEAQLKVETEVQTKSEPAPVQAKAEDAPVQKKELTPEPPKPIIAPPVQLKTETPAEEEVQMKEDEEMSEEAQSVQMKSKDIAAGEDVSSQIASSKGGGSSMDDNIKSDMESGFGHDFSNVRIHTDSQAANMSASLGAKAFTTGNDIYFNDGEYRPDTKDGKHLLAHELTHTLQQGASGDGIQRRELKPKKIADNYFEGVLGYSWSLLQKKFNSDLSGSDNIRLMDQLGAVIFLNQDLTPQELWDKILLDPTDVKGFIAFDILNDAEAILNSDETNLTSLETTDISTDLSSVDFELVNFEMKKHSLKSKKKRRKLEEEAETRANAFITKAAMQLNAINSSALEAKNTLDSETQTMIDELNETLGKSIIDNTKLGQEAIFELKTAGVEAKDRIRTFYTGSFTVIDGNTDKLLADLKTYLKDAHSSLISIKASQQNEIDALYSSFSNNINNLIPGFNAIIASEGEKRYESHQFYGSFISDVKRYKAEAALGASNEAQKEVSELGDTAITNALGNEKFASSASPDSKVDFELELTERTGDTKKDLNSEYARVEKLLNQKAKLDKRASYLQYEDYKIRVDKVTVAGIQSILDRDDTQHKASKGFSVAKDQVIVLFYQSAVEALVTGTQKNISGVSDEIESFISKENNSETPKSENLDSEIDLLSERISPSINDGNSFIKDQKEVNTSGVIKLKALIKSEFIAFHEAAKPKMDEAIIEGKNKINLVKEVGIQDQLELREDHYRSILHDVNQSKGEIDNVITAYQEENTAQLRSIETNLNTRIESFKKDAQAIIDQLGERMDAAESSSKVLAAEFHQAIMAGDEDKVMELLANKSSQRMNQIDSDYAKLYSKERYGRNLYAELYYMKGTMLSSSWLWDKFSLITDEKSVQHQGTYTKLYIEGISNYAPKGSNFTVRLSTIGPVFRAAGSSGPHAPHVIYKAPGKSSPVAKNGKLYFIEIEDAAKGKYDFIFFVKSNGQKLYPLRIQQEVASLSDARKDILKQTPGLSYPDYLANLEYARIQLGGGVTKEQGIGADPRIVFNGKRNPSFYGDGARFEIASKDQGVTYDWYAYQISYGMLDQKPWPSSLSEYYSPKRKQFGNYNMTFQGTGKGIHFMFDEVYGKRIIVAEQIGADGKPTGKFAQYVQKTLETKFDSQWEARDSSESEQYKGLQKATKNAKQKIKLIKGTPVPVRAGYVNTESGTQMSLPLYVGKSANKSKGKYVVVDLLPNQEHYKYYGDSSKEALEEFESGNLYPDGYVFIKIDANDHGIKERSMTMKTNGMSTWQMFTTSTGWASIGLFVGGAILEFVPGGQVAGTYMIVASMTLGVATGAANLYERSQHGDMNAGFVTLEVMNIVGSMLAGGGKVISLLGKTAQAGKVGQFVYYVGEGLDLVDGVYLTVAGAQRLAEIVDSDMTPAQKRVAMVKAISSLILGGYLLANVSGFNKRLFNVDKSLRASDEAVGVLENGVYKLNPTATNVKDLIVNPSGTIKPIKATGGKVINGEFMYVVDDSGKLIIGTRARNTSFSNPPGKAPHPTLIGGRNPQVQAAGMVYFKGGKIHRVDNISGHFKPNSNSIGVAESNFKKYFSEKSFTKDFEGFIPFSK